MLLFSVFVACTRELEDPACTHCVYSPVCAGSLKLWAESAKSKTFLTNDSAAFWGIPEDSTAQSYQVQTHVDGAMYACAAMIMQQNDTYKLPV